MTTLLLLVAAFLAAMSAVISFGWFGTTPDTATCLGLLAGAVAFFAVAHLPIPDYFRR